MEVLGGNWTLLSQFSALPGDGFFLHKGLKKEKPGIVTEYRMVVLFFPRLDVHEDEVSAEHVFAHDAVALTAEESAVEEDDIHFAFRKIVQGESGLVSR